MSLSVTGQNLARVGGKYPTPVDMVESWYNESKHYSYSKYASVGYSCSKEPCGHYTQVRGYKLRAVPLSLERKCCPYYLAFKSSSSL